MNVTSKLKQMAPDIRANLKTLVKKSPEISSEISDSAITQKATTESIKARFMPFPIEGKAPAIRRAYIVNGEEVDVPLLATKLNGSYLIDFDSQTEIMYGLDAIKYLKKTKKFEYDTQVIFPKRSSATAQIRGKDVNLGENSAIMINAGTTAKVADIKGYPMIVLSKRDYDWYERYGKEAKDINIQNKFSELIYWNSHLYNGSFSPSILLPKHLSDETFLKGIGIDKWNSRNNLVYDIFDRRNSLSPEDSKKITEIKETLDKLHQKGIIEGKEEGFIRAKRHYAPEYFREFLQKEGFSEQEIELIAPVFKQARQVKMESVFALKNSASDFPQELVEKMKNSGILHNNKKDADSNVYWKYLCGNEQTLRGKLWEAGFSPDEQNTIVEGWKKAHKAGFDMSGLKFLNEDVAVYNLGDKLNNWTQGKTDWVTNSTAIASSEGKTPFVGVSMVQYNGKHPETMATIRGGQEVLHKHPNLNEKRQTEVYLVTDGAAILNVEIDGKVTDKLIKKGELVVIGPGVSHCVNSVSKDYEHIVTQLPSAFQYGFGFKPIVEPPKDYDPVALEKVALEKLTQLEEKTERLKGRKFVKVNFKQK